MQNEKNSNTSTLIQINWALQTHSGKPLFMHPVIFSHFPYCIGSSVNIYNQTDHILIKSGCESSRKLVQWHRCHIPKRHPVLTALFIFVFLNDFPRIPNTLQLFRDTICSACNYDVTLYFKASISNCNNLNLHQNFFKK